MIGILVHGDNHFVVRGLTTVAHKPRITVEQGMPSYSFRFTELSQPI
jgi:hypothetical protein